MSTLMDRSVRPGRCESWRETSLGRHGRDDSIRAADDDGALRGFVQLRHRWTVALPGQLR